MKRVIPEKELGRSVSRIIDNFNTDDKLVGINKDSYKFKRGI